MVILKVLLHVGPSWIIMHNVMVTLGEICKKTGGIMLLFLRKALPWLFAALLFASGWHMGSNSKDAAWKEVVHNEYITRVSATAARQSEVSAVSAKYHDDYAALEGSTDRVIADLRSANQRLWVKVKSTSGTTGPDGRCLVDGPVELHESTARSLIKITERADLKERALQETIRKLINKKANK